MASAVPRTAPASLPASWKVEKAECNGQETSPDEGDHLSTEQMPVGAVCEDSQHGSLLAIQGLRTATRSNAARKPCASFAVSSLAQKCMKKSRGSSASI
jgi:hypothetical protein